MIQEQVWEPVVKTKGKYESNYVSAWWQHEHKPNGVTQSNKQVTLKEHCPCGTEPLVLIRTHSNCVRVKWKMTSWNRQFLKEEKTHHDLHASHAMMPRQKLITPRKATQCLCKKLEDKPLQPACEQWQNTLTCKQSNVRQVQLIVREVNPHKVIIGRCTGQKHLTLYDNEK